MCASRRTSSSLARAAQGKERTQPPTATRSERAKRAPSMARTASTPLPEASTLAPHPTSSGTAAYVAAPPPTQPLPQFLLLTRRKSKSPARRAQEEERHSAPGCAAKVHERHGAVRSPAHSVRLCESSKPSLPIVSSKATSSDQRRANDIDNGAREELTWTLPWPPEMG